MTPGDHFMAGWISGCVVSWVMTFFLFVLPSRNKK